MLFSTSPILTTTLTRNPHNKAKREEALSPKSNSKVPI
ncbi:hypothetical protein MNB_SV-6-870 [hydrothermal vent metagenome]|uniref:Uncharacterized protein n=1 Tax=hydrothermal vent metagenome TaxID=652676 RepID=A0A1W1BL27_9ZZZZ